MFSFFRNLAVALVVLAQTASADPVTPAPQSPEPPIIVVVMQPAGGWTYEFLPEPSIGYCGGDPVNRTDPMGTKWVWNEKLDDYEWQDDYHWFLQAISHVMYDHAMRPPKPNYRPSDRVVQIGEISFDRGNTSPSVREISAEVVKQSTPGMIAGAAAPAIIGAAAAGLAAAPTIAATGRLGYGALQAIDQVGMQGLHALGQVQGAVTGAVARASGAVFGRVLGPIVGAFGLAYAEANTGVPLAGISPSNRGKSMAEQLEEERERIDELNKPTVAFSMGSAKRDPASPSKVLQDWANAQGGYVNPGKNAWETTSETLAADHILSYKTIINLPGFNSLTAAQKNFLVNNPDNFQPLTTNWNSSKLDREAWDWYLNTPMGSKADPDYIDDLAAKQKGFEAYAREMIKFFQAQNTKR